jgi:hypothetical protein
LISGGYIPEAFPDSLAFFVGHQRSSLIFRANFLPGSAGHDDSSGRGAATFVVHPIVFGKREVKAEVGSSA